MTRTPGSARGAAGNGGPYRHTSQGSSYSRFQRALKTGNLAIIRSAAAELPQVNLGDALAVCVAIREAEPHRYERAALRWLARFCVERPDATLAEIHYPYSLPNKCSKARA